MAQDPAYLELYGAPEHYAVRTVGLPRLGVAGVCLGRVVTSQSPVNAAFNWGVTIGDITVRATGEDYIL